MLKRESMARVDLARVFDTSHSNFDLSIVIPTRNEAGNINQLLTRIGQAFLEKSVEVLFVDDSTDENSPGYPGNFFPIS